MYGPVSEQAPTFPLTDGATPDGSVLAFEVTSEPETGMPALRPAWQPRNLKVPDPVALANGVAFVLATGENVNQRAGPKARQTENTQPAVLYAFDARTGKELYNSAAQWAPGFISVVWRSPKGGSMRYGSVVSCFGLKLQ